MLAAIAAKGVNELAYHRDHAGRWVLRLGDGTAESHRRAQAGVDAVWPLLADLFTATDVETRLTAAGVAVDPATTRDEVRAVLDQVLTTATLQHPGWPADVPPSGRLGRARPGADRTARCSSRGWRASTRRRHGEGDDPDGWTPRRVAESVTDPELPMITLADLGVLRDVRIERDGAVVVEITPTYTGCPAMGVMRADLVHALHQAGFPDVDVRTVLAPAWSTDWITDVGRRKLLEAGHRAARAGARVVVRPGAAAAGGDPADGVVPAVRFGGHRGAQRVQRHRLQGAAPVPHLPGTVRAREGDLMTTARRGGRRSARCAWCGSTG